MTSLKWIDTSPEYTRGPRVFRAGDYAINGPRVLRFGARPGARTLEGGYVVVHKGHTIGDASTLKGAKALAARHAGGQR